VYGIVKQSGGHIWVYSEVGAGTTFKVYFASELEPAGATDALAEPMADLSGTETLLLVEDDRMVREVAIAILLRAGYRVLEAADGAQALELYEQHERQIDLLLTDVVMPRMSGRDLARTLRGRHPELKVLLMTGYAQSAVLHNGALEPGAGLVQKPLTPSALLLEVRKTLGQRRGDS
jgi:CheY-like chemotaxis protein